MDEMLKNKGMTALVLLSFVLIFCGYLAMNSSEAGAFGPDGMKAEQAAELKNENMDQMKADKIDQVDAEPEVKEDKAAKADFQKEDMMRLALTMKLMEADMKALKDNAANKARFFEVNQAVVDKDLLNKLVLMDQAMVEDFDQAAPPEAVEKEEEIEVPDDLKVEDAKQLNDQELMKIGLNMKLMEQDMAKFMEQDSGTWTEFFNPAFNGGFINRPLLTNLLLLHQGLLNDFDVFAIDRPLGQPFFNPFNRPFFGERAFGENFDD